MYTGIRGQKKIDNREYTITDEATDEELDDASWKQVKPGMELSLNIVFNAASTVDFQHCPRCAEVTSGHNLSKQRRRWSVSQYLEDHMTHEIQSYVPIHILGSR